jgi:predicted nuclease of predicted toxin-antitoxin system
MLRFKLDENAAPQWRTPLEQAGHEASTVVEEGLKGTGDSTLARICQESGLCLITADLHFAQIIEYPPEEYARIIVLRHPKPTLARMLGLVQQVAHATRNESPAGRLWIVEPGRIRIHGEPQKNAL